jgi:AraC-like DNA-binding protein
MEISLIQAVILFGGVHGLILTGIFCLGSRYRPFVANKMLGLFLAAFSLINIRNIFESNGILIPFTYVSLISNALIPMIGPSIYLYVRALVSETGTLKKKQLRHFLPALLYLVLLHIPYLLGIDSHQALEAEKVLLIVASILQLAILIVLIGYLIQAIKTLMTINVKIRNQYSQTERLGVNWISALLMSIILILSIWTLVFSADISIFRDARSQLSLELFWLAIGILGYGIGYFCLLHPEILTLNLLPQEKNSDKKLIEDFKLSPMIGQLTKLMSQEKPFLNPELNLQQLANLLKIKPKQLTYVVNTGLNQSFYDFVNYHRIEHIKMKLRLPESTNQKLEVIAYESGISSSSTFNRLFKKFEKMTPKEYRQQQMLNLVAQP